jgi:DNA-binding response OmpR family regulator
MTLKNRLAADEPAGPPFQLRLNLHQHILVVDDDEDIRRLNAEALVSSGYQVDTAVDGARAWDALQIESYDLLLTDYGMPQVNGLNLIKKMRAAHMTIPVILVSGTVLTEELTHPRVRIDVMLRKPYTLDELLASVRKVLHAPRPQIRKNGRPLNGSSRLLKKLTLK